VKLHEYPRPPGDTGIGLHWFPDAHHCRPDDLAIFVSELSALGVSWLAMVADLDHPVTQPLIRGLRELGIQPIVQI